MQVFLPLGMLVQEGARSCTLDGEASRTHRSSGRRPCLRALAFRPSGSGPAPSPGTWAAISP